MGSDRLEEILMEAHAVGMRDEVMKRAAEIREKKPYRELVDSYDEAYREFVESKL